MGHSACSHRHFHPLILSPQLQRQQQQRAGSTQMSGPAEDAWWPGGSEHTHGHEHVELLLSHGGASAPPHSAPAAAAAAATTNKAAAPAAAAAAAAAAATSDKAAAPEPPLEQQEQGSNVFTRAQRWVWSSGSTCILLSAFMLSLSALFVKLITGRVPVLEITLIRGCCSFIVGSAVIKARGVSPMFGHRQRLGWLLSRGVFGAAAMLAFYYALQLLPMADAVTLFFLNPSITAVVAWLLRGEPLGWLGAAGCAMSLGGMVVLSHPPMLFGGHERWGPRRVWGTATGVVSAFFCAAAFISIRFIGKAEPALVVTLYFHLSTFLLSLGPMAAGWPSPGVLLTWRELLLVLGITVTSFSSQLCLTRGFQLQSASRAAGLNFSQVVFSHILGAIFFAERLSIFGALGTLLIAAGMMCVTARQPGGGEGAGAKAAADMAVPAAGGQQGRSSSFVERVASFQRLLKGARSSGGGELEAAAAAAGGSISAGGKGGALASSEEGEGLLCGASAAVEGGLDCSLHSPGRGGVQLLEVRTGPSARG